MTLQSFHIIFMMIHCDHCVITEPLNVVRPILRRDGQCWAPHPYSWQNPHPTPMALSCDPPADTRLTRKLAACVVHGICIYWRTVSRIVYSWSKRARRWQHDGRLPLHGWPIQRSAWEQNRSKEAEARYWACVDAVMSCGDTHLLRSRCCFTVLPAVMMRMSSLEAQCTEMHQGATNNPWMKLSQREQQTTLIRWPQCAILSL